MIFDVEREEIIQKELVKYGGIVFRQFQQAKKTNSEMHITKVDCEKSGKNNTTVRKESMRVCLTNVLYSVKG